MSHLCGHPTGGWSVARGGGHSRRLGDEPGRESSFALLLAPGHGFSASSVNYGIVPKDADTYLQGACPVIGSFGAKDRTLRRAAPRLEVALAAAGVQRDVKEYPDAGHSFLNDHHSVLFAVAGKLIGGGYHEPSAHDARRRIADFFRVHLTADSP
jgi:carboxymethylenebutenolidase